MIIQTRDGIIQPGVDKDESSCSFLSSPEACPSFPRRWTAGVPCKRLCFPFSSWGTWASCLLFPVCVQKLVSSMGQNYATMHIHSAVSPWFPALAGLPDFPWSALIHVLGQLLPRLHQPTPSRLNPCGAPTAAKPCGLSSDVSTSLLYLIHPREWDPTITPIEPSTPCHSALLPHAALTPPSIRLSPPAPTRGAELEPAGRAASWMPLGFASPEAGRKER